MTKTLFVDLKYITKSITVYKQVTVGLKGFANNKRLQPYSFYYIKLLEQTPTIA